MQKVLATGALIVGGAGIMMAGLGMSQQVSAAPNENTSQTTQTTNENKKESRPELTEEQKTAMETAKKAAIASLSESDQKVYTDLESKGHFSLTFAERDQLDAIQEKVMTYMSENPVEGLPTPPSKDGKRENKPSMGSTLTDEQKTELDTLKSEGIAALTEAEQARLKELDSKGKMEKTETEREELHTLMDKVMTYVKSKVSFTMPEGPQKGEKTPPQQQTETTTA